MPLSQRNPIAPFFSQAIAAPAAGAQIIITPTPACHAFIQGLAFRLTTDATAINRVVYVSWHDIGGAQILLFPCGQNQPASQAYVYYCPANYPNVITTLIGTDRIIGLPNNFRLTFNETLRVGALNMQAADQFDLCTLCYERYAPVL